MKILYILGGLLVLLAAVYFGGRAFAGSKLDTLVEQANQDGNVLEFANRDLTFRFTHLGVTLDSVRLRQEVGGRRIAGSVEKVEMDGLSLLELIGSNDIGMRKLHILGPDLEVTTVAAEESRDTTQTKKGKAISIKDLVIEAGRLRQLNGEGSVQTDLLGLSLRYPSFALPFVPASAQQISLQADSISLPKNQKASWSFNDLALDRGDFTVGIARLSPQQAARQQLTSQEFKDDWLALRLDSIRIPDLPLDSLLGDGHVRLAQVTVGDLNLSVLENPALSVRPERKKKKFPLESFREIGRAIALDNFTARRANIRYGVLKEGSEAPDLTFDNGTITLKNWTSYPSEQPATARIECLLDKQAPLTVNFSFPGSNNGRDFSANGELRDYDLTSANPLLEVASNAHIESGYIKSMRHDFTVRNGVSTGELVMEYNKLEVKMTGSGAFFKNIFEDIAIRDSNPRNDGELVTGKVHHEHDPQKAFFNLYWKSLVAGMTSTVVGKVFTPEELDSF